MFIALHVRKLSRSCCYSKMSKEPTRSSSGNFPQHETRSHPTEHRPHEPYHQNRSSHSAAPAPNSDGFREYASAHQPINHRDAHLSATSNFHGDVQDGLRHRSSGHVSGAHVDYSSFQNHLAAPVTSNWKFNFPDLNQPINHSLLRQGAAYHQSATNTANISQYGDRQCYPSKQRIWLPSNGYSRYGHGRRDHGEATQAGSYRGNQSPHRTHSDSVTPWQMDLFEYPSSSGRHERDQAPSRSSEDGIRHYSVDQSINRRERSVSPRDQKKQMRKKKKKSAAPAESRSNVDHMNRPSGGGSGRPRNHEPILDAHRSLLPDGWLDYSNTGDVIEGTRILCLKTPIDASNLYRWDDGSVQFRTEHFFRDMEACGIKVGLIVDLTFTKKYYDGVAMAMKRGIKFVKIAVPGKAVPPEHQYIQFRNELDKFLTSAPSDQMVAVHCTHGVNRTGWFVCRYMVDRLQVTVGQARERFAKARGHDICREYLIADLQERECRSLLTAANLGEPAPSQASSGTVASDRPDL